MLLQGKVNHTYVSKVADLFPQSDIIFLTAMTDKALFHRRGKLVVKNTGNGEYETIEEKTEQIDLKIQDKQSELSETKDSNLKSGFRSQIKDLEKEKKELLQDAIKQINLNSNTM